MEITIKLSPEDVIEALTEYAAKRGFRYVSQQASADGSVSLQVELAPELAAASRPAPATPATSTPRNPATPAVEGGPALSFTELTTPIEQDIDIGSQGTANLSDAEVMNEFATLLRQNDALTQELKKKGKA